MLHTPWTAAGGLTGAALNQLKSFLKQNREQWSGLQVTSNRSQAATHRRKLYCSATHPGVKLSMGIPKSKGFYQSQNIYFSSETSMYSGDVTSETPGDSDNTLLRWGDVSRNRPVSGQTMACMTKPAEDTSLFAIEQAYTTCVQ
ncbi:MAG: hypothetical protein FRX49_07777 [Trebouxia sp. A1-2]|nr:MAG: hypothetical protein FRX49_07777 [Trebouxia sp. A1-2]